MTDTLIMFPIGLLKCLDVFGLWLLRSRMDPERTTILGGPLTAFKAFEALHKQ